jgi:hypothetical protein
MSDVLVGGAFFDASFMPYAAATLLLLCSLMAAPLAA